jgi:hypothetical protein
MSIRQEISRKPGLVSAIAVGAIVLAIVIFFLTREPSRTDLGRPDSVQAWYTDDDGLTVFPDSANKVPPFDHNGKKAYACRVWSCDGGVTKIVPYVLRYKPEAKKALEAAYAEIRAGKGDPRSIAALENSGAEMKPAKTGDQGWVDARSSAAQAMRVPDCPDPTKLMMIQPPEK